MSEVKYYAPTEEAIKYVAENMREGDAAEVMASHGHTPEEAIRNAIKVSDYASAVEIDGELCVIFGLSVLPVLSGSGSPWALGTDHVQNHKAVFIAESRMLADKMLNITSTLYNYIHINNKVSIRWLASLGFEFDPPAPYGVGGELFRRFYLEKSSV